MFSVAKFCDQGAREAVLCSWLSILPFLENGKIVSCSEIQLNRDPIQNIRKKRTEFYTAPPRKFEILLPREMSFKTRSWEVADARTPRE